MSKRRPATSMLGWAVLSATLLVPICKARAHGGYVDALGILLPADQPQRILVSTNFGLLRSDDEGASWDLICEEATGWLASGYRLGPAPRGALYVATPDGVSLSTDAGCSWHFASGDFTDPVDAFPDPTDPDHVFVTASSPESGQPLVRFLFESLDGGEHFRRDSFSAAAANVTSVAVAPGDPRVRYIATVGGTPGKLHPFLNRSADGGQTWETIDLAADLGSTSLYILAVDPDDPDRVYLRVVPYSTGDRLAVLSAAQRKAGIVLKFDSTLSAFLLRTDGSVIAASTDAAFVSVDRGVSFTRWPNAPHLRGLAERDGLLFAATDNFLDGFAAAMSRDGGASWRPLLRLLDIRGPLECGDIGATCAGPWISLLPLLAMPSDPSRFIIGADAGAVDPGTQFTHRGIEP